MEAGNSEIDTFDLTVMHTNDTHGRTNMYPQLVTAVEEVREVDPNALLLDAGDVFSGTLYFNQFRGMDAVKFMNLMEYDAFVPGNHEFDLGTPDGGHPELAEFLAAMDFPTLAANLDFSGDENFDGMIGNGISRDADGGTIYDGIIVEVDGEEIGIFGLDTEDTQNISSPHAVEFADYIETAENMVEQFEAEGVDKIIALTHLGYESNPAAGNDVVLATNVEGIDVIVGGHSHDQVTPPRVIDAHDEPTIIVQAGEYGNYLGNLKVSFDEDGAVVDYNGQLIDASEKEANAEAAEMLEPYTEEIEEVQKTPAGFSLAEELTNPRLGSGSDVSVRANETALGNLIADGFLRAGKRANKDAVISFQNGGGIRAGLPAGDVTVGNLITVQPFGNRLALLELSGAEIIEALEHSVNNAPGENGGFLHVSGMKFTYDSSLPAGERVKSAEVKQGEDYVALEMDKMYVTAMNNFTANGGDGYDVFKKATEDNRNTIVGDTDWEILRNHALSLIDEGSQVDPKVEGRIVDVAGASEDSAFDLTIMHTNDTHGRTNMYPQLVTAVDEVREEDPNALLLDAGDVFSGTLYFNQFRGMDAVKFMNLMEYDAFVPGNHEFDLGTPDGGHPELAEFLSAMDFPTVAANLDFTGDDNFDGMIESGIARDADGGTIYDGIIVEVDGEEVGIFGLDTEDTLTISSPHAVEFNDYIETAESMVEKFEAEGVNKIIALTHLGYESNPAAGNDVVLANNVEGIDVIVGGHSHDQVTPPRVIDAHDEPTIIVQAGEYGNYLGKLNVSFDEDGVIISHNGELIDASEKEANAEAADMLAPYTEEIEEVQKTPAGFSLAEELLNPRLGSGSDVSVRANETALGNLIADGFLRAGKRANSEALISFQNGGGIRAGLPAGDVTVGNLITVQPFGNRLALLELTGAEIIEALEHSVNNAPGENGGFLHVSGMKFTYDSSLPAGERVKSVEVKQGEEYVALEMDKTYVTAMNNFTANGGDGFEVFKKATEDNRNTIVGDTDWEILRNHALSLIDEGSQVDPKVEGRIVDVAGDNGDDEGYGYYDGQSILDIRDTDFGTVQTFYGTVTAHFEEGGQTNMYVQDDTAAFLVRGAGLGSQFNIGDKVQFTGEHSHFRDMNQLLVSDSEIVERNHGQITPKVVDSTFFANDPDHLQAQLIEIKDVNVKDNVAFNDFNAEDSAGNFLVLGAFSDVVENTDYDSVTGIVSYHHFENKLMPRNNDDLVEDASTVQPARANQDSGAIASGTEIVLTSGTEDAKIYYTLNGDDPTDSSTLYDGPITITEETTLKVIAVKEGLGDSEIREYHYTLLAEAGELAIYDIQGSAHVSPYEGQVVRDVPGIVTHTLTNGFYLQSEESDGDVNTSEAVYVYSRGHSAKVGDDVRVDGTVVEHGEQGYDDNDDLTTTQITANSVDVVSSGNELPDAIVIGVDREIPEELIADESNYDINNGDTFNAETNALDFYESLEGMLIEIPGQVTVTGPQKYNELTVVSEEWGIENRTAEGGVYLEESEGAAELNTEIMFVNVPSSTVAKTGDYFDESITGVLGYNFGNFKVVPVGGLPSLQDGGNERPSETTITFDEDKLTVATYNVENYYKGVSSEKTKRLAKSMADELNAPDIITLVEVMDSDGDANTGVTDAHQSYQALIDEIKAQGGPNYAFTEVAPVDGQDGGIPGGNIRNGHLYNVDRIELADSSVAPNTEGLTIDEEGNLSHGTGLIDPTNNAFRSSRKAVVTEFIFKGESVYVIGNHWNSKRGDLAAYGMEQPAVQGSRVQRQEIAEVIGDFIAELNEKNEGANVVALGDFNDFPWSSPVKTMADKGELYNSIFELPRNEQFTYNYNGNSQSLDSILVSDHLKAGIDVDAMKINSEFMETHGRASDHDPFLVQLVIPNIDSDYVIEKGPELTFAEEALNTNSTIELTEGDVFDYPVVTATDNQGTDLDVTRGGDDVDTATAGTYNVVYTATDSEGRTSTLRLTVVVHPDLDMDNLTVAEAIAYNSGAGTVQGYIVGTITDFNETFDGNFAHTNLLLADDPDERDMAKILPVQLPNTSLRTDINLRDNPENLGKEVRLTGNLRNYFSQPGLGETSAYEFVGNGGEDNGDGNGEDNGEGNGDDEEVVATNLLINGGFESWTDGVLDGWDGSSNSIAVAPTKSEDAVEGDFSVNLIREGSHHRFSSESITLEDGVEYDISFMVKGNGDIRNAMFAEGYYGNNYSPYSDYTVVNSDEWQEVTWSYTAEGDVANAQLILSLRNTTGDHLFVDDVQMTVAGEQVE